MFEGKTKKYPAIRGKLEFYIHSFLTVIVEAVTFFLFFFLRAFKVDLFTCEHEYIKVEKIPAALLGASWHMETLVFNAHAEHMWLKLQL